MLLDFRKFQNLQWPPGHFDEKSRNYSKICSGIEIAQNVHISNNTSYKNIGRGKPRLRIQEIKLLHKEGRYLSLTFQCDKGFSEDVVSV